VSTHPEKQPVRHVPAALARGICMDCGQEIAGTIALHVLVHRGVPGIEVFICNNGQMHALVRVQMSLLPVVSA
jgi:hypothetical protein